MDANEILQKRTQERRARKAMQKRLQGGADTERRRVRGLYNEAIRSGMSHEDATAYANGDTTPAPKAKPETPKPEPTQVEIPADWRDLHWRTKLKLAEQITGQKIEVNSDAQATADEIIAAAEASQG